MKLWTADWWTHAYRRAWVRADTREPQPAAPSIAARKWDREVFRQKLETYVAENEAWKLRLEDRATGYRRMVQAHEEYLIYLDEATHGQVSPTTFLNFYLARKKGARE